MSNTLDWVLNYEEYLPTDFLWRYCRNMVKVVDVDAKYIWFENRSGAQFKKSRISLWSPLRRDQPREGNVKKKRRRRVFQLLHHCIAHPLIDLSFGSVWAWNFHDWLGQKAWPDSYATTPVRWARLE